LLVGDWDQLGEVGLLGEVHSVAVDNDVLSKVGLSCKTMVVRHGRLVDGPVVEWRVHNWVLDKVDIINSNFDFTNHTGIAHGVLHEH